MSLGPAPLHCGLALGRVTAQPTSDDLQCNACDVIISSYQYHCLIALKGKGLGGDLIGFDLGLAPGVGGLAVTTITVCKTSDSKIFPQGWKVWL